MRKLLYTARAYKTDEVSNKCLQNLWWENLEERDHMEILRTEKNTLVLWHVDPLLGGGREMLVGDCTAAR
jgi:hypothetical protein